MKLRTLFVTTVCCLSTACTSMDKSILLGTGIGGATGSAIGNNHGDGSARKRMNGALIGAAIGGLIGFLAHKGKNQKKTDDKTKKDEELVPLLTRPKIKRIWVKDEIKGKRFVKGHWEYVIEENSEWSR